MPAPVIASATSRRSRAARWVSDSRTSSRSAPHSSDTDSHFGVTVITLPVGVSLLRTWNTLQAEERRGVKLITKELSGKISIQKYHKTGEQITQQIFLHFTIQLAIAIVAFCDYLKQLFMNTIFLISMPGGSEWVLIIVAVLVLFGGRKIPEFMRGLGKGIREFNNAKANVSKELEEGMNAAHDEKTA